MLLGEYIKKYRDEHGISQRQFAEKCFLSNGFISMIENGKNPKTGEPITPSLPSVKAIASGMGITVHQLLSEVDDLLIDLSEEEKQPTQESGLSEIAIKIAELVDSLPVESRKQLLDRVQALVSAQSSLDDLLKSE